LAKYHKAPAPLDRTSETTLTSYYKYNINNSGCQSKKIMFCHISTPGTYQYAIGGTLLH